MTQAAWKQSGSPIGEKGPRKANPNRSAVDRQGSGATPQLGQGQHPDGCHQPENAEASRFDFKQGTTGRDFTEAYQSLTVQSAQKALVLPPFDECSAGFGPFYL
jgi:hypothetical protein